MTLLKKYEAIKQLIDEKINAFLAAQKDFPTEFYQVEVWRSGKIKTIPVTKLVYYNFDQSVYFCGKQPTRLEIKRIEDIYFNLVLDKKFIRLGYDQYNSYGLDQFDNKFLFLDKNAAEKISVEITNRVAEDERLLNTGNYDRCQRCKKVVLATSMHSSIIFGRDRKVVWNSWKSRYDDKAVVTQTMMNFCSAECAGNEQCSREG